MKMQIVTKSSEDQLKSNFELKSKSKVTQIIATLRQKKDFQNTQKKSQTKFKSLIYWLTIPLALFILIVSSFYIWANTQKTFLNKIKKESDEILNQVKTKVVRVEKEITENELKTYKNKIKSQAEPQVNQNITNFPQTRSFWQLVGSGVSIDKNLILTNKNIISTNGTYRVKTWENKSFLIKREAVHPLEDLAILKILDEGVNLPFINLSKKVEIGQKIWALGNPLGLDHSLSEGIVSQNKRNLGSLNDNFLSDLQIPANLKQAVKIESGQDKLILVSRLEEQGFAGIIEHTAQINYGSSGGPLFDKAGDLVGINSFSFKKLDTTSYNLSPESINNPKTPIISIDDLYKETTKGYMPSSDFSFNAAIDFEIIRSFISSYNENLQIPFLQAYGQSISPSMAAFYGIDRDQGFWIQDLQNNLYDIREPAIWPGGNLAQADLRTGDLVFAINEYEINEQNSLGFILSKYKPGEQINLKYARLENDRWVNTQSKVKLAGLSLWTQQDLQNAKLGKLSL